MKNINPDYIKVYNSFLKDPTNQEIDGFASHQPVLINAIKQFDKPILLEYQIVIRS